MHAASQTLSSTALRSLKARWLRRRAPLRENHPSLFDLLLEESSPWEALEAEQQLLAIDILARLIANATLPHDEEKNDE
jgi:hypothetical protein